MSKDFVLLAGCTSFDIVCDPLVHAVPLGELFSFPDGFVSPWVTCQWVVVHDVHAESFRLLVDRFISGDSVNELVGWDHGDPLIVVFPLVGPRWS